MNKFLFAISTLLLLSCAHQPKQEVDLIIDHATIYTVDSSFSKAEALAIKDGKIIETGSNDLITNKYTAKETINAEGKFIYPGFIDAHCHFYGYGKGLMEADLAGTHSFEEVIERTVEFVKKNDPDIENYNKKDIAARNWIIGRGWDQNDWEKKEFPTKARLDSLFPNTPVILKRIDGHAVLVNQTALTIGHLDEKTKIKGGELIQQNGKLTGILIDNAVDSVEKHIPKITDERIKKALLKAQENCFAMGITTVDDAGLEKQIVDAIDKLQKEKELKMRVYAMLTPTQENLEHYLKNGTYKTDRLNICSFKFYADGALGSRGACLLKDYSDKAGWKGFLLSDPEYFVKYAGQMEEREFQMNTHCIGDSAVRCMITVYASAPKMFGDMDGKLFREIIKKRRWRIEHAQIVDPSDLKWIKELGIIPSVQPTHATSDMYWAEERLGKERVKTAYAYKDLLNVAGMLALGTDFPVEDISPFKTFYAAVFRKDNKGFPEKGYQMENALTREETLRGMTIWAAYSNFEEKEKGSLEKGKFADLIILDTDLLNCNEGAVLKAKVLSTYLNGEKVSQVN
jgi:predicted amidohydrolase YtcJ